MRVATNQDLLAALHQYFKKGNQSGGLSASRKPLYKSEVGGLQGRNHGLLLIFVASELFHRVLEQLLRNQLQISVKRVSLLINCGFEDYVSQFLVFESGYQIDVVRANLADVVDV